MMKHIRSTAFVARPSIPFHMPSALDNGLPVPVDLHVDLVRFLSEYELDGQEAEKHPSWASFTRQVQSFKTRPVEHLHSKGIPAYYRDKQLASVIICHLPDGTRQEVTVDRDGTVQVIREING